MQLVQNDLTPLMFNARMLVERLQDQPIAHEAGPTLNVEQIQALLDGWCQVCTKGDWQRFAQRLSWDGLTVDDVRQRLGHGPEHTVPNPQWVKILYAVLSWMESTPLETILSQKQQWTFLDQEQPYPFEELLVPFVVIAQKYCRIQIGRDYSLLGDNAYRELQRSLLHTLISLSLPTFQAEFKEWQVKNGGIGYQQFLASLYQQQSFFQFLQRYSALARLLAEACEHWIEANIEFVQRLTNDWSQLQTTFSAGSELEQVTHIQPDCSHPHSGRRTVMILTFASGLRLVYKPRSLQMEQSYYQLLDWCNHQQATSFKLLTIVNRHTYGWMEYVAPAACQDKAALQRYYERAGMLLCIVYLLHGRNCFYEQIIACGEHPVLIDASALLQPYARSNNSATGSYEAEAYTVLQTGLLTTWRMRIQSPNALGLPNNGIDISGFGTYSKGAENGSQSHTRLKYGALKSYARMNLPTYEGRYYFPGEYSSALATGFRSLYTVLLEHRDMLLAFNGPLAQFRDPHIRFTYRNYHSYQALLEKRLEPEQLQNGIRQSILLESLAFQSIPVEYKVWGDGDLAHWWPVCVAEQQALTRFDVPFLTVAANDTSLQLPGDEIVPEAFHQAPFMLLTERVLKLSTADMHKQCSLMQAAFVSATVRNGNGLKHNEVQVRSEDLTADLLLGKAARIAHELLASAVTEEAGSLNWVIPKFQMHSFRYQLQPMRYSLFDGAGGVAFFFSAMARLTGEHIYRTTALDALHPIVQSLRSDGQALADEMGIGGAIGLGSLVYVFTRMSQLLAEPMLLESAHKAALLITDTAIARDRALDVIAGTAGALLGLLPLYELTHDQIILERAIACGEYLMEARTQTHADCRAWAGPDGRHLTGFSHGTAGVVYALLRLYAQTGDNRLLAAAQEGLHYEDQAFIPDLDNWMDDWELKDSPAIYTTWCHGAPGIALARIGGLAGLATPRIYEDIERALRTTERTKVVGADFICCGNFGRVDILLSAAQRLGRPELAASARNKTGEVFTRAALRRHYFLNATLPDHIHTPDLFHGLAGIGYTLLRLTAPEILPSVLLWE